MQMENENFPATPAPSDPSSTQRLCLPRPHSQFDPRPELWELDDGRTFLSYCPYVVSSPLVAHGAHPEGGYVFRTANSEYRVDWAPTWRKVSIERLQGARSIVRDATTRTRDYSDARERSMRDR